MRKKRRLIDDPEQLVEETRVAEVVFRRLDLALPDVLEPRLQLPDHERLREPVQISSHGALVRSQRAGGIRRVPHLAVQMRKHQPEAPHGGRRDVQSKLREVPFEESAHELPAPLPALVIRAGDERKRISAAKPEPRDRLDSRLVEGEPTDLDHLHPASERLARLPEEARRSASQKQELRWRSVAIDENAEHLEELRCPLNLVDDHQPPQGLERRHRRLELRLDARILEIEVVGSAGWDEAARERRLADLARTDQHHGTAAAQRCGDPGPGVSTVDAAHGLDNTLNFPHEMRDSQGPPPGAPQSRFK